MQMSRSFPFAHVPSYSGGLAVEVTLIAQLGPGAGNQVFNTVTARQQAHTDFIDALDEPSTKIGGVDFAHGDVSSLYTFAVGANAHPFHCHDGPRIFTAVSGSGGAQLRFSTASMTQMTEDPMHFVRALRHINVPPDCLFTVRFGGGTWHQFAPLRADKKHPALFALSCHTNELHGVESESLIKEIAENRASIPSLTQLLPDQVHRVLDAASQEKLEVPTIALTFEAPATSWRVGFCDSVRGVLGQWRGMLPKMLPQLGFAVVQSHHKYEIKVCLAPDQSLLRNAFIGEKFEHEDHFELKIESKSIVAETPADALCMVLDAMVKQPSMGVTLLMRLRNFLVLPLGLRRSRLGCPVSSLLGESESRFANRFPVLQQSISHSHAEVLLGADDKHLKFRAVISVEKSQNEIMFVRMGTRVQCRNGFGRFYLAVIDAVHRHYIAPTMLKHAVRTVVQGHTPFFQTNKTVAIPPIN